MTLSYECRKCKGRRCGRERLHMPTMRRHRVRPGATGRTGRALTVSKGTEVP